MPLTFGSLFTGIGGFDLGFERAGMTCEWMVEIDDYCNKVLAKHWPDVRRYKDVKECGSHNLEPVDVICGGFPCQPHSVAGKRRGAADDRNLWPEFLRIVREVRPTWVVAENVPGIVSLYLDTVLSDLEGEGYTCWTFNIPACAFDAPHRRERIFVVAYAESIGRNKARYVQEQPRRTTTKWSSALVSNRQSTEHECAEIACADVANALSNRPQGSRSDGKVEGQVGLCSREESNQEQDVSDTTSGRRGQCHPKERSLSVPNPDGDGCYVYNWTVEPNVGRVANGVPARVDRLRALGNAVVPQVAQYIGERIIECHNAM